MKLQSLMRQFVQSVLIVVLLGIFSSGCHTPLAVKKMQAKNPLAKNTAKTPVKVVDMWNSYSQTAADGKVMRGMAGRVHFYNNSEESHAVKVEGNLTVYVFDGKETDPMHAKPIKIFQFKAEKLDEHYAFQKPLGHGYNFFLPIDEIGGEEKPLCIVTRFNDNLKEGTFVMTPLVNIMLAGRKPQPATEPSVREFLESRSLLAETNKRAMAQYDSAIQQTGYAADKQQNSQPETSRVSTIPLNSHLTRRLVESQSATVSVPEKVAR